MDNEYVTIIVQGLVMTLVMCHSGKESTQVKTSGLAWWIMVTAIHTYLLPSRHPRRLKWV